MNKPSLDNFLNTTCATFASIKCILPSMPPTADFYLLPDHGGLLFEMHRQYATVHSFAPPGFLEERCLDREAIEPFIPPHLCFPTESSEYVEPRNFDCSISFPSESPKGIRREGLKSQVTYVQEGPCTASADRINLAGFHQFIY